jgi:ribonuclease Z
MTARGEQAVDADNNCLEVTLTGTQGGPPAVNGLAGAGTLVRYGTVGNGCSDVLLQFDAGRGTTGRLSQLGVSTRQIDAVFLTHLHSDHTEGLAGLLLNRWHFLGGPIDVVCSADVKASKPSPERVMSCEKLITHTADAMIESGEIAQRYAENRRREPGGPAALVQMKLVDQPLPGKTGHVVWETADVSVSAIGTVHIAGSLAYRIDTPAGSVVIGGDAGNSKRAPPRDSSTSESVEALATGADVLVHSTMHPVFAPVGGSEFPPPVYYRQSNVADLGAMARRAGVGHLMLTHLIPSLNTPAHGPYEIPGGPLNDADFESAVREGGFEGKIHVGRDLLTLRLP